MGIIGTIGGLLERAPAIQKAVKSAPIAASGVGVVALAVELGWLPADLSPTAVAALTAASTWVVNTIKLMVNRSLGVRGS